ncbi:hypothetical protein F3Y22_tig00110931pilonHSYRG00122 [Hibiscus syriacus]|uniref:Uncharacterized protein n=1 Tax=Hibiscus syriacus TaxID=106335 RepID=A0A6A2ZFT2_HIBSY|nr:uncharacterized protein LOC120146854 [Hibiscus syriacus]KAE8689805.1 hypothetical protein F3Y22_tig00110931pilonHSYRG00122 [Hibiscus syriacus]
MGSHCNLHYDITMSKRTRKPLNLQETKWDISPLKGIAHIFDQSSPRKGDHQGSDRKSLKQLIKGDENEMMSTSLEEKQLQLVKKHRHDDGLKLKGIMSRYAKVLCHFVKIKPVGSRKKPLLRIPM